MVLNWWFCIACVCVVYIRSFEASRFHFSFIHHRSHELYYLHLCCICTFLFYSFHTNNNKNYYGWGVKIHPLSINDDDLHTLVLLLLNFFLLAVVLFCYSFFFSIFVFIDFSYLRAYLYEKDPMPYYMEKQTIPAKP